MNLRYDCLRPGMPATYFTREARLSPLAREFGRERHETFTYDMEVVRFMTNRQCESSDDQ